MRKLFLKILLFILSFLFFNANYYGTDEVKIDINSENKQDVFNLKFENINIKNLKNVLKETSAKILKIIPKDRIYTSKDIVPDGTNIDKIIESAIQTYEKILLKNGYENESVYASLNGFEISNLIIECNNYDLLKIGEKVKFKIV